MSNSKKGKSKESQGRSRIKEINKFSEILADPNNNYAASLEKLALKISSNNKVFVHIKKYL